MASNLPSSFSKPGSPPPQQYTPPSYSSQAQQQAPSSGQSPLPAVIAIFALLLSLVSFYGAFFAERPLSSAQKDALVSIAEDLKSLQNREISMSAPVQTTISLNRSYPIKDLFPSTFDIPLDFEIPIDTQLIAVGASGQPLAFRVQDSVPIKVTVPISSAKAFGNNTILIQKELPVEAKFTSSIKIRATYGKELTGVIDKLEQMAGQTVPSG